jgi:HK97 family phage portal protein
MNLFSLFKPKPKQQAAILEINNSFSSFSGGAFNSPVFRAAVDAVARHCAKLTAHSGDANIENLLTKSPNAYMSSYDLFYRVAAAYFVNNNSFVLVERDGGNISAFYPLSPSSVEFTQDGKCTLLVQMRFSDGREVLFPYGDIIHLRRHYYGNELSGAENFPLFGLLDTADTLNQGIAASVKNGTSIKGVLKFTSLVNPAQLKAEKEQFIADYFNPGNNSGVAATDNRFDFVPTNITPYNVPQDTLNAVNAQIFAYIGVSPKIVSGEYSEDDFSAFYESLVEPLALQMSLEFSRKTGAEIRFTSERLEYSSAATKIKLLHEAAPLGVLSVNECRRLLALPPVADGGTRLQSLNYVNSAKAELYQEIESEVQENEQT